MATWVFLRTFFLVSKQGLFWGIHSLSKGWSSWVSPWPCGLHPKMAMENWSINQCFPVRLPNRWRRTFSKPRTRSCPSPSPWTCRPTRSPPIASSPGAKTLVSSWSWDFSERNNLGWRLGGKPHPKNPWGSRHGEKSQKIHVCHVCLECSLCWKFTSQILPNPKKWFTHVVKPISPKSSPVMVGFRQAQPFPAWDSMPPPGPWGLGLTKDQSWHLTRNFPISDLEFLWNFLSQIHVYQIYDDLLSQIYDDLWNFTNSSQHLRIWMALDGI